MELSDQKSPITFTGLQTIYLILAWQVVFAGEWTTKQIDSNIAAISFGKKTTQLTWDIKDCFKICLQKRDIYQNISAILSRTLGEEATNLLGT